MRYEFECQECGALFEIEMSMKNARDKGTCSCGGKAKRVWTLPQMIVRGESKNKDSGDTFAPELMTSIGPTMEKAGVSPKAYERIHDKVRKHDEAVAREVSRRTGNHSHEGDGKIRHVGSVPLAKALSMYKENGGEMPTTDQLKRRGCFFEHEKRNL